MDRFGIDAKHHVIAANEGNCAALAAGYHLATGKNPVVYMQNSGGGNTVPLLWDGGESLESMMNPSTFTRGRLR